MPIGRLLRCTPFFDGSSISGKSADVGSEDISKRYKRPDKQTDPRNPQTRAGGNRFFKLLVNIFYTAFFTSAHRIYQSDCS